MVTWAQHLASQTRKWAVIVRIEGVGQWFSNAGLTALDDDGRYRFCAEVPSYGDDSSAAWRTYLAAPLPDILSEKVDILGGFPTLGAVSVRILDVDDFLTSLLRVDAAATTILSANVSSSSGSVTVGSASSIDATTVIYVGAEAMRVTNVAGTTLTVSRGYLSTDAHAHYQHDRVYIRTPYLLGRRMQVHVVPLDGDSSADEQLVGEYIIDGYSWDKAMNVWVLKGKSQLKYLDRVLPRIQRRAKIVSIDNDGLGMVLEPDGTEFVANWRVWSGGDQGDSEAWFYLKNGKEILAVKNATVGNGVRISRRGVLGTEQEELRPGAVLKQVFISRTDEPGDFRWAAGPSPATTLTDADWTKTAHWVDIILSLLTSPCDPDANVTQGNNYDNTEGNWSWLPAGFGLGIPMSLIDIDSFVAVKDRLDNYDFPFFVYGDGSESAANLITNHFLRPMGAYFSVESGQVKLVMPRIPLAGEATVSLDSSDFLTSLGDSRAYEPRIEASVNTEFHASGVTYVVGPTESEITFTNAEFGGTYGQRGFYVTEDRTAVVPVPSGDPQLRELYGARAAARLLRLHKPNIEFTAELDVENGWDLYPGSLCQISLDDMPDLGAGSRGWSSIIAEVIEREIQLNSTDGVFARLRLLVFGPNLRAARISPAAIVTGVAGSTATVAANRYTSSDATGGLPTRDCNAFAADDQVCLANLDGTYTANGDTPMTIVSISPSTNEIELNGDFSGDLAAGTILIVPAYADSVARQTARYAYMADVNTQTVGAGAVAAYVYAEP